MGLRQGSPYRIFMNNHIKKMSENGELVKIMKKWKVNKPDCSPVLMSGDPVKFEKLAPLFMIVAIGLFLSAFLIILESIVYYFQSNSKPFKKENLELLRFKLILKEVQSKLDFDEQPSSHLFALIEDSARKLRKKSADNVQYQIKPTNINQNSSALHK